MSSGSERGTRPPASPEGPGPDRRPPAYPLTSVDNALRLLLELARQDQLRVCDAADLLGVGRSTAHRLLAALQHRGFADRTDSGRAYRAGPSMVEVGRRRLGTVRLHHEVSTTLRSLSSQIDETLHFACLEGNAVRFLAGIESPRGLRVGTRTGMLLPAHTTAVGKALLASIPDDEIHAMFPRGLQQVTEHSLTDVAALIDVLARVRADGVAINRGESESGVIGVAVPVRRNGSLFGALGMTAPESRMSDTRIALVLPDLRRASNALAGSIAGPQRPT